MGKKITLSVKTIFIYIFIILCVKHPILICRYFMCKSVFYILFYGHIYFFVGFRFKSDIYEIFLVRFFPLILGVDVPYLCVKDLNPINK